MINPKLLCRKHLLGAHGELHKFRHNFEKKHSIKGRTHPVVQIEPASMQLRHDELVVEMLSRGYNHNSPYVMPDISYLGSDAYVKVDRELSIKDLKERCPDCKKLIDKMLL